MSLFRPVVAFHLLGSTDRLLFAFVLLDDHKHILRLTTVYLYLIIIATSQVDNLQSLEKLSHK